MSEITRAAHAKINAAYREYIAALADDVLVTMCDLLDEGMEVEEVAATARKRVRIVVEAAKNNTCVLYGRSVDSIAKEIYARMEEVLGSYRPGSVSGTFQMQPHADAATSKGPAKSLVFIPA